MSLGKIATLGFWFSVGAPRRLQGWLKHVVDVLAVIIAVYVVLAATWLIIDPWLMTATFLTSVMTIAFLVVGAGENSDPVHPSIIDYILSAASLACCVFFTMQAGQLDERIALLTELTRPQVFFGTIMVILSIEITRRATGFGLFAIVMVFVAYNLYGHHLGGVISHGEIGFEHFLDITIFTTDGVMGLPARVAATYAFMFVLFGSLLFHSKGGDFFNDIAASLTGHKIGGPAKVAVSSSGLYGMISGSPTADVVTTGSVTIPMMQRMGYSPKVASGIEVAASTGGSIMPPVMGSAAFLMAEFTGIEYRDIAIAALLPALLYYLCVYAQVHFHSYKHGLGGLPVDQLPKFFETLKKSGAFIIPLAVLVWALLAGYSPTMVAVYGSISVIAVSMLKADTRLTPRRMWIAMAETTTRIVAVAGATAAAGLVIGGITMTGLASKFAHIVYGLTGADHLLTVMVAAVLTILLGMGMPTPSAYILAAVLMGPLMKQTGIADLPGHMFLLYFAVLSAITPPVAVAAFAASSISGANPMHIAVQAVKFALAAFLVPFVFVFGPELLWMGPLWKTAITFVTAGIGLLLLSAAIESYDKWCATTLTRIMLGLGAIFLVMPPLWSIGVGVVLCGAAIAITRMNANKTATNPRA